MKNNGCNMIHKNELIMEVYKILKEAKSPLSQSEIIKALVDKGYKQTICYNLFSPSITQPFLIKDDGKFVTLHPLVKTMQDFTRIRTLFTLHPEWEEINENAVKEKLVTVN